MIKELTEPELTKTVSFITSGDLAEVVRLHEEYLNYGPGILPHFEKVIANPDNIALKCEIGGEIAGLFVYTKGISLSGGHEEIVRKIEELAAGRTVYTGDAVLVRREYRGQGVSSAMISAMIERLREKGAELCVHEFWVHPDGRIPAENMYKVFTKNIFLGRFERFYRDFHHFGYICPICNEDCVCSADVYLAELPSVTPAGTLPLHPGSGSAPAPRWGTF